MDDPKLPSHGSSISLIARLDHLEFIMKYLERKQRYGSNVPADKDKQSLDLSTKEAFFKGTLLDRVASLEHRLFKLYVEMDSSGSSLPLSHDSTQTSGESSSSQGSKREICYSFPTFNNLPNNGDKGLVPIKTPEISLEKCESEKQEIKNSCPPKQQVVKNRSKKNEKKCKVEKKRVSPVSWPHLKLLGC
ncbi:hypothetical protein AAZX31_09G186100 [Glycine max]|uniref:Uncharacterized protein n=2 Tax=Glycine subgen. Soja TaxID=1462606 RepID=A0A0R0IL50_SOYBN|nr:uncharacterized protein LOC102669690 [Glycine max]KAG4992191.1 hypothetical protein JHK87_025648 [Glycine soja]KAH1043972.1 hypothetical protein GYH30_025662 [Glycine max]KAH1234455.1 hypothetical protein GmHk_09G026654 [Glycine max]KRH39535.1 hypothetical protein GLYMA_09G204000v4 [Glycine max]|eukprot:XP_006587592.1 uncharacterized protein LOC102669690 [Glycine max]